MLADLTDRRLQNTLAVQLERHPGVAHIGAISEHAIQT